MTAPPNLAVHPLRPGDIDSVLEIQSSAAGVALWGRLDYEALAGDRLAGAPSAEPFRRAWVAGQTSRQNPRVLGFIVASVAADEMEILNLAVSQVVRRQGVGKLLLRKAMDWGRLSGARQVHLEVRASNSAALAFYRALGFRVAGRRRGYYASPAEDALLLFHSLPHEPLDPAP